MRLKFIPALCAGVLAAACSDTSRPTAPAVHAPTADAAALRLGNNGRFVAMGTSVSMGWISNGVYAGSQLTSWPALLGFGTLQPLSLPLIQSPGCTSPLVAPLGNGKRLSGESIAGSTTCAPNVSGVTLPTQNVALAGAIAADAVQTIPAAVATTAPWYSRVLAPGMTQLTAALSQQPTFVSVELGANEVLGATSGLIAPGVTVVPFPFFAQPYNALLNAVGSTNAKVVLVGLVADARNLPALRRGEEIWANRTEFAALNVDVSNDCAGNQNYINVSIKSLNAVFTAAFTSTHGLPNPVFSCADIPGTPDLVLTPGDITTANGMLAQMTDYIRQQAAARGYAYFSLGAMYDRPEAKGGKYSVVRQLTSSMPYGPYVSLDGVHPNPLGHALLALAAAGAINDKYGSAFAHSRSVASGLSLSDRVDEPTTPSMALAAARQVALERRGEQLPACSMPGGCMLAKKIR